MSYKKKSKAKYGDATRVKNKHRKLAKHLSKHMNDGCAHRAQVVLDGPKTGGKK